MTGTTKGQMLDEVCIASFIGLLYTRSHTHDEAHLHLISRLGIVSQDVAQAIGERSSSLLTSCWQGYQKQG